MSSHLNFCINNKSEVKLYIYIFSLLLFLDILLIIITLIYTSKIKLTITIVLILLILLIFLVSKLISVKIFKIENSGMVYSFTVYSLMKKGWIIPSIEFPIESLENFSLQKKILYLTLKTHENKIIERKFMLQYLNKNKICKLKENLNQTIKKIKN